VTPLETILQKTMSWKNCCKPM